MDALDSLLLEVKADAKRKLTQATKEADAAARAEKHARFQALRAAFDAERFRWVAQHPEWLFGTTISSKWTLDQWRSQVDLAMRKEHKQCRTI